ncbi:hypothetical protein BH09PAT3_BH09PAT3_2920 [soil metagenome]
MDTKRLIVIYLRRIWCPGSKLSKKQCALSTILLGNAVIFTKTMKQNIYHHRHFQVCAALIVADCLVFTLVNPSQASATWLITGYVLLGLTLFGLASLLATTLKSYGERAHGVGKRLLRYGATAVVAIIGLQSIGQLTVKDVMTLLPFIIIAYLYFGYGKKLAPERT